VVPALALVLSVFTIVSIGALERRAATSSDAEAELMRVDAALSRLQRDPFDAMAVLGGSRSAAYARVADDRRRITGALAGLRDGDPPAERRFAPVETG
jgi:hypothetical protein